MDPSSFPVLVGAGQILQREDDPLRALEPLALMQAAAERAAADAGAPALLSRLDTLFVPQGLWRYTDPGRFLGERFGASGVRTGLGPISGATVQVMISKAAREIAAGRSEVALVVGAESERTRRRARRQGVALRWTEQEGGRPDERFESQGGGFGWWERRYRARPIQVFALYENAIRSRTGESPDAHRSRIAALWARFARVASRNPYAWIRDAPSAEAIRSESEHNRMQAWPYTKRMVANMVVDLGAAVLLCSAAAARRHGVADDRRVFLHASTQGRRQAEVSSRLEYHEEPAIGLVGRRALELAGAAPHDFAHVDLYSCFPSAVQMAASALDLDLERELTVTGGLTFAGGPFNSYVLHAVASMMERLRAEPGTRGLVSSVGGYMEKHAFGIYGSEPPEGGFVHETLDARASALPTRAFLPDGEGSVRVETFTVQPGLDGAPASLLFACRTERGERVWGTSEDPELLAAVGREELLGRKGSLRDGVLHPS